MRGPEALFPGRFCATSRRFKNFVSNVLGPDDDITRFEYMQKTNKESGPALVGIELKAKIDYYSLMERMNQYNVQYKELNKDDALFAYLV
ncbi:hypothetical protein LWM68_05755 [Niabella sp. W65]|nr:hypothetical protein [Niabella sp. W65]MCH7362311.1 hypothetical protein [Niabella sp. W65]ULT46353.1 hypothetical protein KRR40_24365 [Niabella sp. I65]